MEIKKSPKKNLESKKSMFFQIGLVLTLGAVLAAFQYKTPYTIVTSKTYDYADIIDEDIPITVFKSVKPIPPLPKPPTTEVIKVVDNNKPTEVDKPDDKPIIIDKPPIVIFNSPIDDTPDDFPPSAIVELMPAFPGCEDLRGAERDNCTASKMTAYIGENINFPPQAREMDIKGTAYVYFVIDKKGKVTDAKIMRGVAGGKMLDKEALRVVESMPTFTPGEQMGRTASVIYRIPIKFDIKE